jgi:hypothetical protein
LLKSLVSLRVLWAHREPAKAAGVQNAPHEALGDEAALDLGLQIAAATAHHVIFRGIGLRLWVNSEPHIYLIDRVAFAYLGEICRLDDKSGPGG